MAGIATGLSRLLSSGTAGKNLYAKKEFVISLFAGLKTGPRADKRRGEIGNRILFVNVNVLEGT